ncbi:discoidin domain-containing protein, partial [bacterium]|nr:discoidin domain-containing protein [bacterium]
MSRCRAVGGLRILAVAVCLCGTAASAAEFVVHSDKPNAVTFTPQDARFVRFVIQANTGGEPCLDELEVYGPDATRNLALAKGGAKATASSCLTGYAKHQIEHLNDGLYGNEHSWIAGSDNAGEWAQIELPKPAKIAKVVFSRDRLREYADRVPVRIEVQLSMDGKQWATASAVTAKNAAVATRRRAGTHGFSGVVPPPPPPPRVVQGKAVPAVDEGIDLQAPTKDELGFANLALDPKAKAAASSALAGHAIHKIAHLNDGKLGNSHSWISGGEPSWAEIDLGEVY